MKRKKHTRCIWGSYKSSRKHTFIIDLILFLTLNWTKDSKENNNKKKTKLSDKIVSSVSNQCLL